jgi:hypothetical protein
MNKSIIFVFLLLVIVVFLSGCVERQYEQPREVTTTTGPAAVTTTQPVVKTFKVGETATNGKLAVTVNSRSFSDKITYTMTSTVMGKEYTYTYDYNPKPGYKFLILDLTVENLQSDKTVTLSSLLQFKVTDKDGYSYDYSIGTAYLDRKWTDGDLLPGQKRRGNVAFEVAADAQGIKFNFLFELGGATAVFDLTS